MPVASAIAAGYDAALENLGRVMATGIRPPPPDGDQVAVLSHRIAQGTNLAAQKREEVAQLEAQIADAIGEDEARALFSTIATEPSDFLADKRRLVREAAQAQQAANNAEADAAQAKQLLDDIHLTVPELKALMVERERELHNQMETQFEVMRKEMESRLAAMETLESRLAAMERAMESVMLFRASRNRTKYWKFQYSNSKHLSYEEGYAEYLNHNKYTFVYRRIGSHRNRCYGARY